MHRPTSRSDSRSSAPGEGNGSWTSSNDGHTASQISTSRPSDIFEGDTPCTLYGSSCLSRTLPRSCIRIYCLSYCRFSQRKTANRRKKEKLEGWHLLRLLSFQFQFIILTWRDTRTLRTMISWLYIYIYIKPKSPRFLLLGLNVKLMLRVSRELARRIPLRKDGEGRGTKAWSTKGWIAGWSVVRGWS